MEEENIENIPNNRRCYYCQFENPHNLIQCNMCNEYFCNSHTPNNNQANVQAHLLFHLQRSHHNQVRIFPFNDIIRCEQCGIANIFDLYRLNNQTLCRGCLHGEQNALALIRNNNLIFFNEPREDPMELREIIQREEQLENLFNQGPLPRVTD
jgi:hypothetical protein